MSREDGAPAPQPGAGPRLDAASLEAWRALPAGAPAHSSPPSWRSVLVRHYDEPARAEDFTTAPSRDLLLVIQRSGRYRIESRRGTRWTAADYAPGAMGLTAPEVRSTLRWRPLDHRPAGEPEAASTVQVHLASALVDETARALGQRGWLEGAGSLELHAPAVLSTVHALAAASLSGVPRLAGEALAEALAAQLIHALVAERPGATSSPTRVDAGPGARRTRPLGRNQLERVVDHLHAHLAEPVGLEECAALVGSSRSHFLRAFSAATGTTPHRYLVRLRLDRAARLLRTSEATVLDIAVACGYAGTSHFAQAFASQHGLSPTAYRSAHR